VLTLAVDPAASLMHGKHQSTTWGGRCCPLQVISYTLSELHPARTIMYYLEHRVALFKTAKTLYELAESLGYSYDFLKFNFFSKDNSQYYTEFRIAKKAKKERVIAAPDIKLKRIQQNLADILLYIFRPKSCVHAFVKNKNIVSNASPHLRARHILRLDLKDFFPSIHYGRVRNLFEATPFLFSRPISTAIARICCYKGSLPQGAPTSPIVSNMICLRMDAQLTNLAKYNYCTYTRYADDITFSTNHETFSKKIVLSTNPLTLSENILKIIENDNYFKINFDKTNLRSCGDSKFITGVKVNSKLNVARKKYREVRAMLHAVKTYGHSNALKEHIEKYTRRKRSVPQKDFYNIIQGKIAFLCMVRGNSDPLASKLKKQLDSIMSFQGIKNIDEDLIKYVEECGYNTTRENGVHYIFLNLYKGNKKQGSIRQKISNGKMDTNLEQFATNSIAYINYPNNYNTFENLYPGDRQSLRRALSGCEDAFGRIYLGDGVYI